MFCKGLCIGTPEKLRREPETHRSAMLPYELTRIDTSVCLEGIIAHDPSWQRCPVVFDIETLVCVSW